MSMWTAVLAAGIICLALKEIGYAVPAHWMERPRVARTADLLTVALLGALVAVQTLGAGAAVVLDARVPAVIVATGLLVLRAPFLVVVVAAALVAAILRHPAVATLLGGWVA